MPVWCSHPISMVSTLLLRPYSEYGIPSAPLKRCGGRIPKCPQRCDTRRTLTVAQLKEHRPVKSVPPTRPLDPKVQPAAPHVDQVAFPALPPSSHDGIGGIPGTKDFPKGTTEGFQAFIRPDANTVVPRAIPGRTGAPPSTTTTVTTSSPAVPTAVATITTATTAAPSSSTVTGKKT